MAPRPASAVSRYDGPSTLITRPPRRRETLDDDGVSVPRPAPFSEDSDTVSPVNPGTPSPGTPSTRTCRAPGGLYIGVGRRTQRVLAPLTRSGCRVQYQDFLGGSQPWTPGDPVLGNVQSRHLCHQGIVIIVTNSRWNRSVGTDCLDPKWRRTTDPIVATTRQRSRLCANHQLCRMTSEGLRTALTSHSSEVRRVGCSSWRRGTTAD
jgi:hypothetical protein